MSIKLLNVLKKEITEQGGKFKQMTLPSGEKSGDVIGALEFDDSGKFVGYISPKDVGVKTVRKSNIFNTSCNAPVEEQSRAILLQKEGFIGTPIWDINNWRIGYGSDTITKSNGEVITLPNNPSNKPDLKDPKWGGFPDGKITEDDALRDKKRRLNDEYILEVNKRLGDKKDVVPSSVKSIFVSMFYNYGSSSNKFNDAINLAKNGDYCGAADKIESRKDDGPFRTDGKPYNYKRRMDEAQWIRDCVCSSSPVKSTETITDSKIPTNIIIGDSQCTYIDNASLKSKRLSGLPGGEDYLWLGGKGLSWLMGAVKKYPKTTSVNNVIISIGTNGGFNVNEDIDGLVGLLREKFPNAKLIAVPGSWGWGGNVKIKDSDVTKYYKKFQSMGVTLTTPIGKVAEPHGDLPIYKKIGSEIDSMI
jgi:hypothetical protein